MYIGFDLRSSNSYAAIIAEDDKRQTIQELLDTEGLQTTLIYTHCEENRVRHQKAACRLKKDGLTPLVAASVQGKTFA